MEPLFLTTKFSISSLRLKIYDFQLRDHYRKINNIYHKNCNCSNHSHKKSRCPLTFDTNCSKCNQVTSMYMPFYVDLFHPELLSRASLQETCLFKCNKKHYHIHYPPCNVCIGCKTRNSCIVTHPIECDYDLTSKCEDHSRIALNYSDFLYEHLMENGVLFYVCRVHVHRHKRANSESRSSPDALSVCRRKIDKLLFEQEKHYDEELCYVQLDKCCDNAILITEYKDSFLIIQTSEFIDGVIKKNPSNYIIYNPTLWKEHTKSQFISFIKAMLLYPALIDDRYAKFEDSNFKVGNIGKYKSGNHSGVRIKVTGFETRSAFQTATISSCLGREYIILPVALYESLSVEFDLEFCLVIRHPAINNTCLYVVKILKHTDCSIQTITINHHIAKGLNQDQDGDKNIIFLLRRDQGTFAEKLARFEIACAFDKEKTLLCENRYSFSENSRLLIYRNSGYLYERSSFYRKTRKYGLKYMLDAGHGFLRNEYKEFCKLIDNLNDQNVYVVTLSDLIGDKSSLIDSIVNSEAKGHHESIQIFRKKLFNSSIVFDDEQHQRDSKKQMNRYINSSIEVRNIGRESFILIIGQQDIKIAAGVVSLNNINYADMKPFAGFLTFLNNYASYDQFIIQLKAESQKTISTYL